MGASAQTSATSTGDVLNALDALIAAEIDGESFVVIGHSFGAHLARGVAARHPDRVAGIALVSPYARGIRTTWWQPRMLLSASNGCRGRGAESFVLLLRRSTNWMPRYRAAGAGLWRSARLWNAFVSAPRRGLRRG